MDEPKVLCGHSIQNIIVSECQKIKGEETIFVTCLQFQQQQPKTATTTTTTTTRLKSMARMYSFIAFALLAILQKVQGTTNALRRVSSNDKNHKYERQLTECDTFKACYLVNIDTRTETRLVPGRHMNNTATLDLATYPRGYSIRCDVTNTPIGESDFIKFMYNDIEQDEFALPRFINGDSHSGDWINPVPYLQSCGHKIIKIEGHVWSKKCFEYTYQLNMICPVCPIVITNLILVDAVRRTDIMELTDFSITATMPSNELNIRAVPQECEPRQVDSVQFIWDNQIIRCEKYTPYALYGDPSTTDIASEGARYNGNAIPIGTHTIRATPYDGEGCTGTKGTSLTRTFTVTA